jgi:hypothetical protein
MAGKTTKELLLELEQLKADFERLKQASTELADRSAEMMEGYRKLEKQRDEWKMKAQERVGLNPKRRLVS